MRIAPVSARHPIGRRAAAGVAALAICVAFAAPAFSQFGRRSYARLATADDFDGSWHFCRLAYRGRAWGTDYPDADYNFSTRLAELTRTAVSQQPTGEPRPLIVRPIDDTLFRCPFVMLWQAESLWIEPAEAARLREYLLKGGFIWADDSWGSYAWDNFADQIAKVLPPSEYPFVDIPPDHTMFRTWVPLKQVPQIPGISYWWGSGGNTSEQGADSAEVHVRGIFDRSGRLMVLATHNTDIADGWEREGVDIDYFRRFSVDAYAVGINVALYALTR